MLKIHNYLKKIKTQELFYFNIRILEENEEKVFFNCLYAKSSQLLKNKNVTQQLIYSFLLFF